MIRVGGGLYFSAPGEGADAPEQGAGDDDNWLPPAGGCIAVMMALMIGERRVQEERRVGGER